MGNKNPKGCSEKSKAGRSRFGLYSLAFYAVLATVSLVSVKYFSVSVGATVAIVGMALSEMLVLVTLADSQDNAGKNA